MLVLLMSTCLLFNQPISTDDFQVLNRTNTLFSASLGNQEYHLELFPDQDRKALRFDNQGRFIEVHYLGLKQLYEVELRTNFSGELVTHRFVLENQKLLATEEAWQFLNLLEAEARPLFTQWQNLSKQARRDSPTDFSDPELRSIVEGPKCNGLKKFGLGSDISYALDSLYFNCTNTSCIGCCAYYGCVELAIFLWHCEGRACEFNFSLFP